ncbi:MAG: hypothetical protein HYZ92_04685 [Candidatus Omnitrophica bacterium]|nr:hypothetical protein [Candidatus Omnitrophota bacterium]
MKPRPIIIHTWDYGRIRVHPAQPREAAYWLSKLLREGLWQEVRRFPKPLVAKLLPQLTIPPATRRFLELLCR